MLLQVHDELIFEVSKDALNETTEVVRKIMEKASEPVVKLDVPLVVDAGFGRYHPTRYGANLRYLASQLF